MCKLDLNDYLSFSFFLFMTATDKEIKVVIFPFVLQ